MTSQYALFLYNPMMNSTTYVQTSTNKEGLIRHAHSQFQDNLMFSIYKFRDHCFIGTMSAKRWDLDTKFDGSKVAEYHKGFNQPMECGYQIDDGYEWYFKTF